MQKMLTMIIPLYNEAENIKKCIQVLLKQSSQEFRVIFIDDGSTDSTLQELNNILEATQLVFDIKILKQENQGAARARQLGIQNASTPYIAMLDCDDSLSPDYVEQFYHSLSITLDDPDIIIPDLQIQNEASQWKKLEFYTSSDLLLSEDCIINSLGQWKIHGIFSCKRDLILKSTEYYSKYNPDLNYINNDEIITRLNFYFANSIVRSKGIYYYHFNSSSTTNKVNKNKYLKIRNAFILQSIFKDQPYILKKCRIEVLAVIWGTWRYMQSHRSELPNLDNWINELSKANQKLNFSDYFYYLELKQKLQWILLKLNLWRY